MTDRPLDSHTTDDEHETGDDLIRSLRVYAQMEGDVGCTSLYADAADEIERLRAKIDALEERIEVTYYLIGR